MRSFTIKTPDAPKCNYYNLERRSEAITMKPHLMYMHFNVLKPLEGNQQGRDYTVNLKTSATASDNMREVTYLRHYFLLYSISSRVLYIDLRGNSPSIARICHCLKISGGPSSETPKIVIIKGHSATAFPCTVGLVAETGCQK